jgi:hypothetical protein
MQDFSSVTAFFSSVLMVAGGAGGLLNVLVAEFVLKLFTA